MIHTYINKHNENLIILLHGTGGDENSLINLAAYIDDNASVLGIRGNVSEDGMNRFFKRIRPGIFDELNLKQEANILKDFICVFVNNHNYKFENVMIIGYSNGANILGGMLYLFGGFLSLAVLMHPMIPLKNIKPMDLKNANILITSGNNDPLVSNNETDELFDKLKNSNANVNVNKYNSGHQISQKEVDDIKSWYINNKF